ncbi:hypothetical protein EV702DRAFT_1104495 [Suillus placidus]|uniref:Crinkler effector protein N-terminal domain-containing protein n=1 Tax=Suillus placidus TaxID=48579 RepID=A0A9P6ZUB8_9AGAM|nr:hypothetical protein EV702DRAFT_1104495 [Suillus placidus]
MSDTIQLNCWVFLDDPQRVFTINIQRLKNAGDLEKAIKRCKVPIWDKFNVDLFELWKVDIEPEKLTQTYWIPDHVELDWAFTELSTVFDAEFKDRNINVILARVSDLTLALNCLIKGDAPSHIFTVKVPATKEVYSLKKEIKHTKDDLFYDYDATCILPWKVYLPCDDKLEDNIKSLNLDKNQVLHPFTLLSDVFPTIPAPDHVHIVFIAEHETPLESPHYWQFSGSTMVNEPVTSSAKQNENTVTDLPSGRKLVTPPTKQHEDEHPCSDPCKATVAETLRLAESRPHSLHNG